MAIGILLVVTAYFWGAIPTSQIVAKRLAGIDLRQYGSGNVGGSNVMAHVGKLPGFLAGSLDFLKGMLPVLLAKYLALSSGWVIAAAIAPTCGHAWSIYLGFTGGRGNSTALGALAVLSPWTFITLLGFALVGKLAQALALTMAIGFALSPLFAWLFRSPPEALWAAAGLAIAIFLKRALANDRHLGAHGPWQRVLLYRLLYDRDIADAKAWINRKPEGW